MKCPLPFDLLLAAMDHGALIDLTDGKLSIVTDVLPDSLAQEIEEVLRQAMRDGDEVTLQ